MLKLLKKWSLPHSSYLTSIQDYLQNHYHSEVETSKPFRKNSKKSSESYDDRLNSLAQNIYERHTDLELEALKIRYEYELDENLRIKIWFPVFIVCVIAFIWPINDNYAALIWPANKFSTELLALFKKLSPLLPEFRSFLAYIAITYWLKINQNLKEYLRVVKLALLIHRSRE